MQGWAGRDGTVAMCLRACLLAACMRRHPSRACSGVKTSGCWRPAASPAADACLLRIPINGRRGACPAQQAIQPRSWRRLLQRAVPAARAASSVHSATCAQVRPCVHCCAAEAAACGLILLDVASGCQWLPAAGSRQQAASSGRGRRPAGAAGSMFVSRCWTDRLQIPCVALRGVALPRSDSCPLLRPRPSAAHAFRRTIVSPLRRRSWAAPASVAFLRHIASTWRVTAGPGGASAALGPTGPRICCAGSGQQGVAQAWPAAGLAARPAAPACSKHARAAGDAREALKRPPGGER